MPIHLQNDYCSHCDVMVSIKVKLQKRPGHRGKYMTYVVTIPKAIIDAAPGFQDAEEVEIDVDEKSNIILKAVKN